MKTFKSYFLPAIITAVLFVGVIYFLTAKDEGSTSNPNNQPNPQATIITNYEECVAAGNPSLESYPARCITKDGQSFTQDIGNELDVNSLIRSENPRPGQKISSPLEIKGEAVGNWFFEASFPAQLIDDNGKELAVSVITAQGEWMTTDFVPYLGTIKFSTPSTSTGTLILRKDNPSGLPENDQELLIPVRF